MNPEEHKRIVDSGIKMLNIPKPQELSELERLLARFQSAVREVAFFAREIDKAVVLKGQSHDRKALTQTLSKLFADKFSTFTKDELLMLLVVIHTEEAVENMIGGSLDKPSVNL